MKYSLAALSLQGLMLNTGSVSSTKLARPPKGLGWWWEGEVSLLLLLLLLAQLLFPHHCTTLSPERA